MNRKKRDQTRYNRREVELDSDSIYYVSFAPKSGEIYEHSTLLDDPWNVRLDGNPIGKPELVDAAIKTFETKNNVNSWKELAISYEVCKFNFA